MAPGHDVTHTCCLSSREAEGGLRLQQGQQQQPEGPPVLFAALQQPVWQPTPLTGASPSPLGTCTAQHAVHVDTKTGITLTSVMSQLGHVSSGQA